MIKVLLPNYKFYICGKLDGVYCFLAYLNILQNILSLRFGHEKISTTIPFRWFKKGSCQLLAKEWALSTSKLPSRRAQEQYG